MRAKVTPSPLPSRIAGSWAPRPGPCSQVTTRAWYLCWAALLPSSCEAEKLRYLVDCSWLQGEEAGAEETFR